MTAAARRLGLEGRELRVFAWSAAVLFVAAASHVAVKNVSEALFVKRAGVENLPLAFLASSAVLVATTYALGRLADGSDPLRLLRRSLAVLAVLLVPLWWSVRADSAAGPSLLLVASKQVEALSLIAFWVALGSLLHARQAKRLYAPLTAGGTLGTALGSFASEPLARWLGVEDLLLVAAGLLLASSALVLPLARLAPPRLRAERGPRRRAGRTPPRSRVAVRTLWGSSWLFRALVVSSLCAGLLGPMLYFQFQFVANRATGDAERLLALYAQVRGWLYLAVLASQLLLAPRLYRWLGVPLATALSPLLYLAGLAGLSVRLALPVGVAALSGVTVQDHAVYDPAQRVLFNLFPERWRARVTALIDGSFKRAGNVGGNLLTQAALMAGGASVVGLAGLPIAGAWLVTTLVLWRAYPTLLLEVTARGRRFAPDAPVDAALDAGTLRALATPLAAADGERRRAAIGLVREAPPARAAEALVRALPRAEPEGRLELLAALDDVLEGLAPGQAPAACVDGLRELLEDEAALERTARPLALRSLGRLASRAEAGASVEAVLRAHAAEPDPALRLAAVAALDRCGLLGASDPGLDDALALAAASEDGALRRIAAGELGDLLRRHRVQDGSEEADRRRFEARLGRLVALLGRPEDRPAAATALARAAAAGTPGIARAAAALRPYRHDPDPAVRAAVLRFIGHAGLRDEARSLLDALSASDPVVSAAAVEGLRALGPQALDLLLLEASLGRRSHRDAVVSLLGDLPIEAGTLRDLVEGELAVVRRTLVNLSALAGGEAPEIVLQRLGERVEESVHTTLLLLAALHHEERIAELGDQLVRAHGVRERVLLLEALEALLVPEDRDRLLPLIDDRPLEKRAAVAAAALGVRAPSPDAALREARVDPDPITRALLAATLPQREADGTGPDAGPPPEVAMLDNVEIVLHLKSLRIFERLTTRQLTDLASVVRQESHPAGAVLVREGEFDDCMYLIVDGRVRITKGETLLRDLGPREFFGEMAVFDGATRSATAVALERVHLLRLERHDLTRLMEELPAIAIAICQTLSRRLREMSDRVQS